MHLLPVPRQLTSTEGVFALNRSVAIVLDENIDVTYFESVFTLVNFLETVIGTRPVISKSANGITLPIHVQLQSGDNEQAYRCDITPTEITLVGQGYAGLHYGIQTLLQIIRQSGSSLTCSAIEDAPDYPVRGLYFDMSRGKIPTLDELFAMVDRLASYKMNQFQIYIEHTYAFRNHPDIWAGADALSAEDILKLDAYCRKQHIELIPSMSSFGHFATAIKSKRKEHLNERVESVSDLPFSWWERVTGYTLDVSNDESIALIKEMIEELSPLFTSEIFNICCDETWDLGKGKNKERAEQEGVGALYIEFVTKISEVVSGLGKRPMLWGDVILHHPELIEQLPENAIALNYDTSKNSSPDFKNGDVDFYICVQLSSQNRWVANLELSTEHLLALAQQGKANGAMGFLANEWGDGGHINCHTYSLHGIILGAALSWNVESYTSETIDAYDKAFGYLEFGDSSGEVVAVLRKMAKEHVITWHETYFWIDSWIPEDWREPKTYAPDSLVGIPDTADICSSRERMLALSAELKNIALRSCPADGLAYQEMLLGARGIIAFLDIVLVLQKHVGKEVPELGLSLYGLADDLRYFERDFHALWHKRNRPSEYYRIQLALTKIATLLDGLAVNN